MKYAKILITLVLVFALSSVASYLTVRSRSSSVENQ